MNFIGTVKIKNPYPVTIPSSDLKVKIFIENSNVSNIKITIKQIEGSSFQTGEFEILLPYQELLPIVKKFQEKNFFTIRMDGLLQIPIPLKFRITSSEYLEYSFSESKKIPIFIPLISIENFKINDTSISNTISGIGNDLLSGNNPTKSLAIQIDFDLLMSNSYATKFKIKELGYSLDLSEKPFLSSKSKEIINNGNDSRLKVTTKLDSSSIVKSGVDFLKKKSTSYKLQTRGILDIKDLEESIEYNLEKEGILSW